jgi:hypothetical protein
LAALAFFLAANVVAAETNAPATLTREELADSLLQVQAQLHSTQLALEQNQQTATAVTQSNVDALTAQLQSLQQAVAAQHAGDTADAHLTQKLTLLVVGIFGLAGLGILLLMVYFQSRALAQFAQVSAQQSALIANNQAVHQLAAPGRATVETSNRQLLDAVGQLKARINELENGQLKTLPDPEKK